MKVEEVTQKQLEAIKIAAANSQTNPWGLSFEEAKSVCFSIPPQDTGAGLLWITERHKELWQEMEAATVEELVENFSRQISNRNILERMFGDA